MIVNNYSKLMDIPRILEKIYRYKKCVIMPSCQEVYKKINDYRKIKIVQNKITGVPRMVFIRFDTNCRIP